MPIHQALQLAYAFEEGRACDLHGRRRGNQIVSEGHALVLLRREAREQRLLAAAQVGLGFDHPQEFRSGLPSDLAQVGFGQRLSVFGLF